MWRSENELWGRFHTQTCNVIDWRYDPKSRGVCVRADIHDIDRGCRGWFWLRIVVPADNVLAALVTSAIWDVSTLPRDPEPSYLVGWNKSADICPLQICTAVAFPVRQTKIISITVHVQKQSHIEYLLYLTLVLSFYFYSHVWRVKKPPGVYTEKRQVFFFSTYEPERIDHGDFKHSNFAILEVFISPKVWHISSKFQRQT